MLDCFPEFDLNSKGADLQLARTETLKAEYADLWARATRHPFIEELGDGTLPIEKFRRYFLQDYVFVNDLARMSGIAIARAPDLPSARPVHEFLANLMGAEDALFLRAFADLDIPESTFRAVKPLPTTTAFGDFLVRLAYEGAWEEICAAMLVTEGVYLEWGERLNREGARPENPFYREWIEIHTAAILGAFVAFLTDVVDDAPESLSAGIARAFEKALVYEVDFWDMAYQGESAE